jgi:Lipase
MLAQTESGYGTQWIYFPDGNGVPQKAYLEDPEMPADGNGSARSFGFEHLISDAELEDIKFLLYNQDNINTPIRMQIPMDLSKTGFIVDEEYDSGLPTKIIIHGWKSSANSEIGQLIKNAYLQEEDMNVIRKS